MSEVFVVAPLDGVDAVAVRSGDDILVHVSSRVPRWARRAAAHHLQQQVRAAKGAAAAASLPIGEATSLADRLEATRMPIPRSEQLGAVAAAFMLDALCPAIPEPFELFGAMIQLEVTVDPLASFDSGFLEAI